MVTSYIHCISLEQATCMPLTKCILVKNNELPWNLILSHGFSCNINFLSYYYICMYFGDVPLLAGYPVFYLDPLPGSILV